MRPYSLEIPGKSDVISTRRRKRTAAAGAARSLAFGKFPKVSKKKEEVEDAEESLSPEELAVRGSKAGVQVTGGGLAND